MASGSLGGILRHLGDLFHDGTAVGLADAQLLARYAQSNDGAAFEALVARHGPMVLATCRAVLKDEHDVEDAFQTTFLVLARKARSIRAGDALGGWLHRVAYRAAVQASAEARQRRRRETEAAAMGHLHASHSGLEPDVSTIVHEEVDRLPDRHRLPVVLCDLEGLTYEEAAGRLRWTEPTLRHRLLKARSRLRERLFRRGVTTEALGVVLAGSTAGARGAVPAALVRSVVAAATGGTVSITAAALASVVLRNMAMTKLKTAAAGVLAAIAITTAGVGIVAVGAARQDEHAAMKMPGAARGQMAVQPIPSRDAPAAPGPGIEGRIVDLEGRPVAGARIQVMNVWSAPDNDLGRWLDEVRDRGVDSPAQDLSPTNMTAMPARVASRNPSPTPANGSVTTGPDGRFRLASVGPEQLALIQVSGPTIATMSLYVTGRDGPAVRAAVHYGLKPSQVVYHTRRFEYAAAPGKPIEGVVRDKDTGRPLAGITLRAAVFEERSFVPAPGIEATTDERGYYRLAGLPRAPAYRVFVDPGAGRPYLKAALRAEGGTPAFDPLQFDIALKRGIWVRGKVTDKATGHPVSAMVDAFAFVDNPHVREFPGYRSSGLSRARVIDGRYEVVALPGRGIIAVVQAGGYRDGYRRAVGAEAIKEYDPKNGMLRTEPQYCHPGNYNAVAEINLDPAAESAELDLQVHPGRSLWVHVVDPAGQFVAGTIATGVSDEQSSGENPQSSATFEILALGTSQPRRVTIRHDGRKLIGSVYLKGDETGPLTIRLQPYGTITGRIVDDDGRPRGGFVIASLNGSVPQRPAEEGVLPGGRTRIGRDGRFRIEGLVPGLQYGAGASEAFHYFGDVFRDVTVAPGEVKDLGDLKLIPPRRGN
jgi:RNA polymerase sigma factor (sigma-70 family)